MKKAKLRVDNLTERERISNETRASETLQDAALRTAAPSLRRAPRDNGAACRAKHKERREGHMKDALALGGEEGRDKLR